MTKEDIKEGLVVRNIKHGTVETVLAQSVLMKDSKHGLCEAVAYTCVDRFKQQ